MMSERLFSVYILYSAVVDRYYVGKSIRYRKQIERHNSGRNAHTKSGIPWKVVLLERYPSEKEAEDRLKELRGSRSRKELTEAIRSDRNEI